MRKDDPNPGDSPDTASAPRGMVHDLGYARYDGPRRPQSTRYRTIARNVVRTSWRGLWRMKIWIFAAILAAIVQGTLMYVMEGVSHFLRGNVSLPLRDTAVLNSFGIFETIGFFLSIGVGSSMIANDLRAGAFIFYFARPLRPVDYLSGKLLGSVTIVALVVIAGPTSLALFHVGLAGSDGVGRALLEVPKAMLVGVVATLVYAVLPVAFSAMSRNPRYTVALWVAFYLVLGFVAPTAAAETDIDALAAFDSKQSLEALAYFLFEVAPVSPAPIPPPWAAGGVLALYLGAALSFIYWRISSAERAGLGGSS